MKAEVIRTEALTRVFGSKRAVDGVSFSISEGEFVGLLGPNGAGKTTTIKMLTGLLKPTSGSIYYYSRPFNPQDRQTKALIGVVPQFSNLDRDLTAYENLKLHCILYGIKSKMAEERISEALEFAGLTEWKDRPVRVFSGGMRRRLVIVRALLHEPKIVFMDEPTVGLDPQSRRSLWDLIVRVNRERSITVVLTTHYIEEAERLCERVLIINQGRIIADGEPPRMKQQLGRYVLEVFHEDRIEERFFHSREEATEFMKACDRPCKLREVSLEDLFLKLTGRRIDV